MIKVSIDSIDYIIYEKDDLIFFKKRIIADWLKLAEQSKYKVNEDEIESEIYFTDIVAHAYCLDELIGSIWATKQPELGLHYYCERFLFKNLRSSRKLLTLGALLFRFMTLIEDSDIEVSFITRKHIVTELMAICGEVTAVSHLDYLKVDFDYYLKKVGLCKNFTFAKTVKGVLKNIYPANSFEKGDYPQSLDYTDKDGSLIIMKAYKDFYKGNTIKKDGKERSLHRRAWGIAKKVVNILEHKMFDIFQYSSDIEALKASDYSICNILAWEDYREVNYYPIEEAVLLEVVENGGDRYFWAPIGVQSLDDIGEQIVKKGNELNIKKIVKVPEHLISGNLKLSVDWANSDYIYRPSEIVELPDSSAKKRQELNQWRRQEPLMKTMNINDFSTLNTFFKANYDINGEFKWEYKAFIKLFNLLLSKKIENVVIEGAYIKDRLVGFLVAEERRQDVLIHFLKINREVKGCSFGILFNFIKRISSDKYINFMQDLGIEGLKYFKKSLKPHDYIRKYTVMLNELSVYSS